MYMYVCIYIYIYVYVYIYIYMYIYVYKVLEQVCIGGPYSIGELIVFSDSKAVRRLRQQLRRRRAVR